jgi:hypothetical protein
MSLSFTILPYHTGCIAEHQMTIDADVLDCGPVNQLGDLFAGDSAAGTSFGKRASVPAMLNALGACAGFAAQAAVWRELVLPANRNPGDFLVFASTKSRETFFFGEAINQFLFSSMPDRVSFLTLAAATLSNASELPDIAELAGHVSRTVGGPDFGRPRLPETIALPELPRAALARSWGKAARILNDNRAAEWPALLGATAYNIANAQRASLAPPLAVKILLEAAVPMSKLDPATVEQSGIPAPALTQWSMRALHPENAQTILNEVRAVMPVRPARLSARPIVIAAPTIAFVNIAGASCEALVAQDRATIGGLFQERVQVATTPMPACDVLFIYCAVEPSGRLTGQAASLRDLIAKSGARIAVVASEVAPETFTGPGFRESLSRGAHPVANIVITLSRNGDAFGRFFTALFQMMWSGKSMPMAWVELAPQGPQQPKDIPGTVCLMEAGHIRFGKGGSL